jgi:hypothetical protein
VTPITALFIRSSRYLFRRVVARLEQRLLPALNFDQLHRRNVRIVDDTPLTPLGPSLMLTGRRSWRRAAHFGLQCGKALCRPWVDAVEKGVEIVAEG